jgi:hypothetical protein
MGYKDGKIDVKLSTKFDTIIELVSMCLVMSDYENFFASENVGAIPPASHAWHTGTGDRYEEGQAKLPSNLRKGDRARLGGFTGFEVPIDKKNFRIYIFPLMLGSRSVAGKYGIWGDSEANEIRFKMIVY